MRLSLRLLLGFFVLVAVAAWFVLNIFLQEVKPGVRRATEGTLIDTAQLLAQLTSADLADRPLTRETLVHSALARAVAMLNQRPIGARIDGILKDRVDYRLYVTDRHGTVLFDSTGKDLGADYSRWNDVYLTLQGRYGARSSREDPGDAESTIMYVAAPLLNNGQIRGVLSVGKPNRAMTPVIARSERTIQLAAILLLGIALLAGGGMVWWLNRSLRRLELYAGAVGRGEPVALPSLGSPELTRLGQALESMRRKLEGKAYVEQYVHSLTHELKSPLSALQGAVELLQESPPEPVAQRFLLSIREQSERMLRLIDKMLQLASLESRPSLEKQTVQLDWLIGQQMNLLQPHAERRHIQLDADLEPATLEGDALLLGQALANLLDNAIDFSPDGGLIHLQGRLEHDGRYQLTIQDQGPGIPDYALERLFERFYSLPRPHRGKSTGLGLSFVREVVERHQGNIQLLNRPDGQSGACAELTLPIRV
jgi:two-component system, OmpR family, sensor histidine kinase CreC